eukprot:TRINITY_DN1607_c0_g1_i1.p1 TRINITY_DN1607_c0_g1~~TRINITY_DN1607_c0_g1_i1.p1  ORF type:complete len:239 (+),score=69.37 TRINITY_DN1607_c0_g1_i1:128-844(+)
MTTPHTFSWELGGRTVLLAGSFNNWQPQAMQRTSGASTGGTVASPRRVAVPGTVASPRATASYASSSPFVLTVNLQSGVKYEYKFVVDGHWCYDARKPQVTDPHGNINNTITISSNKHEEHNNQHSKQNAKETTKKQAQKQEGGEEKEQKQKQNQNQNQKQKQKQKQTKHQSQPKNTHQSETELDIDEKMTYVEERTHDHPPLPVEKHQPHDSVEKEFREEFFWKQSLLNLADVEAIL